MNQTFSIQKLDSGGVITNYYCNSSCRHCLYRSGPLWPEQYMERSMAEYVFLTVKKLGCSSVHIGGGEPFLNQDRLCETVEAAKACGMAIEYIETSSSWYEDDFNASRIINKLKNSGVSTLLVSISPFHNEHIPLIKVKNILRICKENSMNVFDWNYSFLNELELLDQSVPHSLSDLQQTFGEEYPQNIPSRYWISPGGRALEFFKSIHHGITIPALLSRNRGVCTELSSVDHFHIDLFGNYIPGLCSGLSIRLKDLGSPLDPEMYPIITTLTTRGIHGFLLYAMDRFGFEASKASYLSKCELCFEIRKFFVRTLQYDSIELRPVEFYYM